MTPVFNDLDALVDRNEIAHILGIGPTAVSNYVARTNDKHLPFPPAAVERSLGRFRLWFLDEVKTWHTFIFPNRAHLWDNAEMRLAKFRETYSHV